MDRRERSRDRREDNNQKEDHYDHDRRRRRSRSRDDDRNQKDKDRRDRDDDRDNRYRDHRDRRDRDDDKDRKDRRDNRKNDSGRRESDKHDNNKHDNNNKESTEKQSSANMSLFEQMSNIMSKSERRDVDPLIIDSSKVKWGKDESLLKEDDDIKDEGPKFKADFGLSGALAKDEKTGNIVNGVVLKFTEPIDAAIPKQLWRFYVFKGDEIIETLHLHRQSAFLLGRDDRIADLLITHPSCSKQHAVLQFRAQEIRTPTGSIRDIKPYIMDLGSVHKTYLNNTVLDDARYYELRNKDMIKFGSSTREYVLMLADGLK